MKKNFILIILSVLFAHAQGQISDTIYINIDNAKIHTVLTKPANSKVLAIIIAGSGPTDLNGNQTSIPNNSLLYLSDALAANNIATVRFDKRGIAGSSDRSIKESDITIYTFANDVVSITNHFKQQGFKDIYLIGHSEGSLIGLIAAQNMNIKGFISLAGAGNRADSILKKQLKPQCPPALYSQTELLLDSLKNGMTVKSYSPLLVSLFRPSVQPYLISWFRYDPAELIKNLKCPVMIVQGDKDIQVDLQESEILAKAAPTGKYLIIKDMNHVLKTIAGDMQENIASYTNPALPVNDELVKNIVEFIKQK